MPCFMFMRLSPLAAFCGGSTANKGDAHDKGSEK